MNFERIPILNILKILLYKNFDSDTTATTLSNTVLLEKLI